MQEMVGTARQEMRGMEEMGELAYLARVAMEEQEGTPIPEERVLGELEGMGVQDKVVLPGRAEMGVVGNMDGGDMVGMEETVARAAQSSSSPVRVLLFPEQSPEDLLVAKDRELGVQMQVMRLGDRRGRKMQGVPQERGGKAASMRTKRRVPITGPTVASMGAVITGTVITARGILRITGQEVTGLTETPVPDRKFQNSTFKPCKPS